MEPQEDPGQASPDDATSQDGVTRIFLPPTGSSDQIHPSTQPLLLVSTAVQNLESAPVEAGTNPIKIELMEVENTRTPASPSPTQAATRNPHFKRNVLLICAGIVGILAIVFGLFLWTRPDLLSSLTSPFRREPQTKKIPAVLRPYVERAKEGDTKAMRMLGTMYYYGLNVKMNQEEARRWFRKATEAGDPTAQNELQQMEAGPVK
jgi:hypothetical protein